MLSVTFVDVTFKVVTHPFSDSLNAMVLLTRSHRNGDQTARRVHILCSTLGRLYENLEKAVRLFMISLSSQSVCSYLTPLDTFHLSPNVMAEILSGTVRPLVWD